jgi:hypothetical protein
MVGIIQKDGKIVCPGDDNDCFTREAKLKELGWVVNAGSIVDNYRFVCGSYRALLYRAGLSWFIRDALIENTCVTYWLPLRSATADSSPSTTGRSPRAGHGSGRRARLYPCKCLLLEEIMAGEGGD